MSRESPIFDYQRPPAHPDRWQLWHVIDILMAGCVVAALYCGFMSFVLSKKLATKTPGYAQFENAMLAQAATRPAGTGSSGHHNGQAFVPRPLFSMFTTYLSIGFAGASVALFVLRRIGRAERSL